MRTRNVWSHGAGILLEPSLVRQLQTDLGLGFDLRVRSVRSPHEFGRQLSRHVVLRHTFFHNRYLGALVHRFRAPSQHQMSASSLTITDEMVEMLNALHARAECLEKMLQDTHIRALFRALMDDVDDVVVALVQQKQNIHPTIPPAPPAPTQYEEIEWEEEDAEDIVRIVSLEHGE